MTQKKLYAMLNHTRKENYLDKLKEDKKAKSKKTLFILGILFISLICFAVAEVVITQISPVGNITTSNSSQVISFNISTDYMNSTTFNWDETNYSIYDDSLVLDMPMNNFSSLGENDTYVVDTSAYGNNGTVANYNNAVVSLGKYNNGRNFNGSTGTITIVDSNSLDFNKTTISFWFKSNSNTTMDIIHKGTGTDRSFSIWVSTGKKLTFTISSNGSSGTSTSQVFGTSLITDNNWHYLTGVYDLNNIGVYVDGNWENNISWTNGIHYGASDLIIGSSWLSANNLNGSIDDLIIWNRSLSASEISQLYKTSCTRYNLTDWNCQFNQSLISNGNSTNPLTNYNYQFCSSNLTTQVCSANKVISASIPISTITTNFSNSVGIINNDFYAVNLGIPTMIHSTKDITCDFSSTSRDLSWEKQTYLNRGSKLSYYNVQLENHYLNTSNSSGINFTAGTVAWDNLTDLKEQLTWDYNNDIDSVIILAYMPTWLADNSSGNCNNLNYCPASNYTKWNNIILNVYQYLDQGRNVTRVQIWNEPDYVRFEGKLTSYSAKSDFVILYNNTQNTLKNYNSNIIVEGYGGTEASVTTTSISAFTQMMISNLSIERFSYHPYDNAYINYPSVSNEIDYLLSQCVIYGSNCSHISLSEWQLYGTTTSQIIKNQSNGQSNQYKANLAYFLQDLMNGNKSSITTQALYHWDDPFSYFNCPSRYEEYPEFFSSVSDSNLDNPSPTYYPPYNITKNFATLCPSGASVYISEQSDNVVQVNCRKGNMSAVILINKGETAENITLDTSLSGVKNYTNFLNRSQVFKMENNLTYLPIMDTASLSSGTNSILWLVEDLQSPTLTINSPLPQTYTNNLIDLNITLDEEGNTCFYSLDGASNVSMDATGVIYKFEKLGVSFADGLHNLVISCNDTSGNWGNNNVNFVARYIIPTDEAGKFWDDFFNAFAAKTTMTFLFLIIMVGVLLLVIFKIKLVNQTAHV